MQYDLHSETIFNIDKIYYLWAGQGTHSSMEFFGIMCEKDAFTFVYSQGMIF
ncbi:hypothetical protein VT99_10047 [Candidatus Electrothrix marina]|uniref:Uncharacterized protein n=1 Tax=Candidatus Electrothrix marina TaxID=1859130 RepID=A0A3S3RDI1_9BACT|nr:hypothetical protein VT99_10047 [Candidatus Electrothrix marina]RWX50588.1 hypothetical protein VU00_10524 [Candidatus Electrothrix marina]